MATDRRTFLQLLSTGAFASAFPASIKRALAIPAHHHTGTIADVEHVVFLMQENRAFDHYYGTLRGVRGFRDPRAVKLPSGDPVFYQPDGADRVLPFHPDATNLGLQFLVDLDHSWGPTHEMWNGGKWDRWIPTKTPPAMAYLTRNDIPFHYALADAFTICDAYHCSLFGPTDPNRYHMWTGWVGNDGLGGGPVLNNAEAGYDWTTYPERLTAAGVTWKIYQDAGVGLTAEGYWGWTDDPYIGNYGDTSILYFHQFQSSTPGTVLHDSAFNATNISAGGTLVEQFAADVMAGTLPQVSWIVAPEAFCEHGNWPSNYGAWYIAQFLDALTANPEVWSKTVLFLTFDENDGFFDHVVSPTPPQSRAEGLSTVDLTNEIFPGNADFVAGPYGLGVRVPMTVISPWSKGGWVSSEVFDHTSLIQFLEKRFGVFEPNITAWRRAITGDLTSAFNFKNPNAAVVTLPSTAGYYPPDHDRHPDYVPDVPAVQVLPAQEPGTRPARPVPYELSVVGDADLSEGTVKIHFANSGDAAAVFQVRPGLSEDGPWTYTVGSNERLFETWAITAKGKTSYDLSVYGANGFYRTFKGSFGKHAANLLVRALYQVDSCGISLDLHNRSRSKAKVRIFDNYKKDKIVRFLDEGERITHHFHLGASFGWYDLKITVEGDDTFEQHVAGHVETGRDSMTDPLIGAP